MQQNKEIKLLNSINTNTYVLSNDINNMSKYYYNLDNLFSSADIYDKDNSDVLFQDIINMSDEEKSSFLIKRQNFTDIVFSKVISADNINKSIFNEFAKITNLRYAYFYYLKNLGQLKPMQTIVKTINKKFINNIVELDLSNEIDNTLPHKINAISITFNIIAQVKYNNLNCVTINLNQGDVALYVKTYENPSSDDSLVFDGSVNLVNKSSLNTIINLKYDSGNVKINSACINSYSIDYSMYDDTNAEEDYKYVYALICDNNISSDINEHEEGRQLIKSADNLPAQILSYKNEFTKFYDILKSKDIISIDNVKSFYRNIQSFHNHIANQYYCKYHIGYTPSEITLTYHNAINGYIKTVNVYKYARYQLPELSIIFKDAANEHADAFLGWKIISDKKNYSKNYYEEDDTVEFNDDADLYTVFKDMNISIDFTCSMHAHFFYACYVKSGGDNSFGRGSQPKTNEKALSENKIPWYHKELSITNYMTDTPGQNNINLTDDQKKYIGFEKKEGDYFIKISAPDGMKLKSIDLFCSIKVLNYDISGYPRGKSFEGREYNSGAVKNTCNIYAEQDQQFIKLYYVNDDFIREHIKDFPGIPATAQSSPLTCDHIIDNINSETFYLEPYFIFGPSGFNIEISYCIKEIHCEFI